MQLSFKDQFSELPGSSRIWLFSSDRPLTVAQTDIAGKELDRFVAQWAAHGKKLTAQGAVLLDRFIILAVDEANEGASGCSIDSSVHFLKDLGRELNVDFFNRMKLYVLKGEEIVQIHIADLPMHENELLFDPMMADLADFRMNFLIPVKDSMLYRQFA